MANFTDLDDAENTLGKPVDLMTDTQLVSYIKMSLKNYSDLNLPVQGQRERSIMAALKRTYGSDAGKIVKWAFYKHRGRKGATSITYSTFASGMKWWTDLLYVEMQEHLKSNATQGNSMNGFSSLADI